MKYKMYKFCRKSASNWNFLKRDHFTALLKDLKWINFNSILQLNEASLMYKKSPCISRFKCEKDNFDLRNKVTQRITRNSSDLHVDYRITAIGEKAVSVSGANLWKPIMMYNRNPNTIATFKNHMYQHLLESQQP